MAKKRPSLPTQKLSRQKNRLLMKSGGELDDMMGSGIVEKMNKGGNAKRLVKMKNGVEKMQAYKLGGGSHNTFSE